MDSKKKKKNKRDESVELIPEKAKKTGNQESPNKI